MAKKKMEAIAVDKCWKPDSSIQLEDDDCIEGCKVGGTCECTVKMKLTRDEVRKVMEDKKESRSQSWKVISIESGEDDEEKEDGKYKQSFGRGMK